MSEIQKKSLVFFLFPNASIFNEVKDTDKWAQNKEKIYFLFFLPNESIFGAARDTKNLSKREEKELVSFLECEDFIQ